MEPGLTELTPFDPDAGTFPHLTDRAGPIALAIVVVVLAAPGTWLQYGPAVAAIDVPLLSLGVLPIMTFVWAYLATLEWPIDERTVAFMTVIVTGVVTSLAVRLVLLAANL